MLLRPGVMSMLDVLTRGAGGPIALEELVLAPGSELVGRTLEDARIRQRTGALVVAIRSSGTQAPAPFRINPPPAERLTEGDRLVALGEERQIDALQRLAAPAGRSG